MDPIDELKESIKETAKQLGVAQRALQTARIGEAEKEWIKQQLDTATKQITSLNNAITHFSAKR
ncbi:MAG TPA: hypothetical protein VMP11_02290 [Verrucomicrobiae bacterium]|nr:hypothetical protein [Verrucomicrobiae bacterium]